MQPFRASARLTRDIKGLRAQMVLSLYSLGMLNWIAALCCVLPSKLSIYQNVNIEREGLTILYSQFETHYTQATP